MAAFLAQFFPARCLLCGREVPGSRQENGCCPACSQDLRPYRGGHCPGCGLMFAPDDPVSLCLECRLKSRPWNGFGFFGPYQGVLRDLILKYKFQGGFGYAHLLQSLLLQAYALHLSPFVPDLVLPVPMHPARLAARGFNQSLELGRGAAKHLGVDISLPGVVRRRHSPAQTGLPRKERLKNVQGVFAADKSLVQGRKILVVDDIYTTGATMTACTRVLQKSGAQEVRVLVLARAVEA
ncbi:MAG: ComF family protein [Desulfohalobiaceae bacterium]|nr:ComF family protein [Desulfohalobiaceae bacterium]